MTYCNWTDLWWSEMYRKTESLHCIIGTNSVVGQLYFKLIEKEMGFVASIREGVCFFGLPWWFRQWMNEWMHESTCNAPGFDPWVRSLGWEESPGQGNTYPLQYSGLEDSMDREAWQATVHGTAKSRTRLSNFHFTSEVGGREEGEWDTKAVKGINFLRI